MLQGEELIPPAHIAHEVGALKNEGYRFVTMTCLDTGDGFEVLYHFDKDYQMKHLRIALRKDEPLHSISNIFFAAVLVENEIQDLFGLKVSGLVIDYKGKFLLAEGAPKAPMCKQPPGVALDVREKPAGGEGAGRGA